MQSLLQIWKRPRDAPPVCCCEAATIGAPPLCAPGLGAPWSGGSPEGNCEDCCTAGALVAGLFCVGALLAVAGAEKLLLAAKGLLVPARSISAFDKLISDSKHCQDEMEMKHQQYGIMSHTMLSQASSMAANHSPIIQSQQSCGGSFAFYDDSLHMLQRATERQVRIPVWYPGEKLVWGMLEKL